MSRLIDADEFIKRIDHYPPDIRDTAKKELRYCKTVDAVPVKHGKWVEKEKIFVDGTTYGCSNCGGTPLRRYSAQIMSDYCPWCGAKMDLIDDDTKWEATENGVRVTKHNCTKEEIEEVKAIMGEKVTE